MSDEVFSGSGRAEEKVMKLELDFYGSLCATAKFNINGVYADPNDFGQQFDHDPDNGEDYGCGDMQFVAIPSTPEVLAKYGITEAEYALVARQLEAGLSFGSCGWCV